VAVNAALVAFAGTITEAGTLTAALLLDSFTDCPPLPAAELSVTVQTSVPDPVIDALLQESANADAALAVADRARGEMQKNIKRAVIRQERRRHIPARLRAGRRLRCVLRLDERISVAASS
jgi:hypothetical protein